MENNFWKNKRVAVTGASGFIGVHIVNALVAQGAVVRSIVSKNTRVTLAKETVTADLLDKEECKRSFKNQEVILHLAALDGGAQFKKDHAAQIYEVNTHMAENVLMAAKAQRVGRILLMSSIDVYKGGLRLPVKEEYVDYKEIELSGGYARAKRKIELMAKEYSNVMGITIVRSGNIYGPGDDLSKGRVIPSFFSLATQNKDIKLIGAGLQKRAFLYVTDAAMALLRLTQLYAVCDPVNLVADEYVTIRSIAEKIVSLTGSKSRILIDQKTSVTSGDVIYETKKAVRLIGVFQTVFLKDGIAAIARTLQRGS